MNMFQMKIWKEYWNYWINRRISFELILFFRHKIYSGYQECFSKNMRIEAWSAPAANWFTASGSCADGSRAVANAVTSLCSCVAAVERLLIGSAKQPSNSCWLSASRLWNASVLIKACCADCKDAKPLPSVCKSPATACIASVVAVPLLETELFRVSMPVCNCSKPTDKVLIC